ncbi:hypothetical protein RyT2_08030 [Pseudolactococcus yaeyamensis]
MNLRRMVTKLKITTKLDDVRIRGYLRSAGVIYNPSVYLIKPDIYGDDCIEISCDIFGSFSPVPDGQATLGKLNLSAHLPEEYMKEFKELYQAQVLEIFNDDITRYMENEFSGTSLIFKGFK